MQSLKLFIKSHWDIYLVICLAAVALGLVLPQPATHLDVVQSQAVESRIEQVTLTATGAAGAATGSVATGDRIRGPVRAIYVNYTAGISTTTDLTIATTNPSVTILTNTDSATDTWFYPGVELTDSSGSGLSAYEPYWVDDNLTISAAQSTSGTVAIIRIYYGQ